MRLPTIPRRDGLGNNLTALVQQEELNRDFVSAISTLEVMTTSLKEEMHEMKKSVNDLVRQIFQIKLMLVGLVLGVFINANPDNWVKFFHTLTTIAAP